MVNGIVTVNVITMGNAITTVDITKFIAINRNLS